ncbi:histidine--tRNA ligase [Siansivirga zeaxanthinifaciens]|uniref:Histidine--tRNA ligase n=1 Tax=Siansivirga zeaxanthinifaciens CC-SAMT-1 TaxID=1454006 RepID=A0A0C5W9Q4_9FLAO|nr:histidine--tRNA ligase [Siansivirga zeaxanthinifaciens]AJR03868.1 histidyl-tRNA synthase [Siansivirga zeaxanthinifaciens CC-SAMT-1]
MAQKPSIPKGTRDFNPEQVAKRNYIFNTIRSAFETFGFQPIETPSFENSETLMGKYGDEGDRLIFKILNSGDYLSKADATAYTEKDSTKLTSSISEKALRYDLTVPFARYVVQHQNEIEFPFKRYQIQPVWRADRPQKGRFREFYQCDADVVGSDSLWQEVEFIQLYDAVFSALKLEGVTIKINNRKILSGIAEVIGASDKLIDFTVALDKLDKIGEEKVKEEMLSKGISEAGITKLQPLFTLSGSFESQIESLKGILSTSEEGKKGIEELAFINEAISVLGLSTAALSLDVTLARGLNYYTGAIFEVAAPKTVQMGSIGGGGRYDDLTGIFGLNNVSGVGISFGLDRIYLVLEELNLFPETVLKNIEVLFINFGNKEALFCLKAIKQLRLQGINAELYPDAAKMKKQMNHANKRNIPFVVLVGEEEINSETYSLKNMITGEQLKVDLNALIDQIKK